MSPQNESFFDAKKEWSRTKDKLLHDYLVPYVQKILQTKHPLLYVDCFAGRGVFEDGSLGSPRIALDVIKNAICQTKARNIKVNCVFIEKRDSQILKENIEKCEAIKYVKREVVGGSFDDQIGDIIHRYTREVRYNSFLKRTFEISKPTNLFLYIDPYGIKGLNYDTFFHFATPSVAINTVEILLNFNSFGFVREACRICKKEKYLTDTAPQLEEGLDIQNENSLDRIVGGNYWKAPILKIKKNIKAQYVEMELSALFCNHLKKIFKYVFALPIKSRNENAPIKYRMIYMTNHRDGAILMITNMLKRWEDYVSMQGQDYLWKPMPDGKYEFDYEKLKEEVLEILKRHNQKVDLYDVYLEFYETHGFVCTIAQITEVLKEFEKSNRINVTRNPPCTKSGKVSTFWTLGGEKNLTIEFNGNGNDNS